MVDVPMDALERELEERRRTGPSDGPSFWSVASELLHPIPIANLHGYSFDPPANSELSLKPASLLLAEIVRSLEKLGRYGREKLEDRFVRPMEALTCETFETARRQWHDVRHRFRAADLDQATLEWRALEQIVCTWDAAIDRERNQELLRDFSELINEFLEKESAPVLSAGEAIERLAENNRMTTRVLHNLLVRLVLFSSPERATLIYYMAGSPHIIAKWVDRTTSTGPALMSSEEASWPEWLDEQWSNPRTLESLSLDRVREFLNKQETLSHRVVEVRSIADDPELCGFFLLQWRSTSHDIQRFDEAIPAWLTGVQAFLLKRELTRQATLAGRVFSMIAHNVGAPLFRLASDAQVLLSGFLEQDRERRFEKYEQILRESRHLRGMVDAILNIDNRQPQLLLKLVPLAGIVHDAVRSVRAEARKYVAIHYQKPDAKMLHASNIVTDEVMIFDIMLNLLANAVKYSPQHGIVEVRTNITAQGAEIVVSDEGPGIPDDERSNIFKPFFRGRSAGGHVPGLGLGLYVVDVYTKALHGRVQVVSNRPSKGTSFHVYLPRLAGGASD